MDREQILSGLLGWKQGLGKKPEQVEGDKYITTFSDWNECWEKWLKRYDSKCKQLSFLQIGNKIFF